MKKTKILGISCVSLIIITAGGCASSLSQTSAAISSTRCSRKIIPIKMQTVTITNVTAAYFQPETNEVVKAMVVGQSDSGEPTVFRFTYVRDTAAGEEVIHRTDVHKNQLPTLTVKYLAWVLREEILVSNLEFIVPPDFLIKNEFPTDSEIADMPHADLVP